MAMGRRLKNARLAKRYSLRDVEKLTEVSASTVSRSENDQINSGLRVDILRKLALCYGTSMDYLLDETILVPIEEQAKFENALLMMLAAFERRFGVAVSCLKLVRSGDYTQLANLHLFIEEGLVDGGSDERPDLESDSESLSDATGEPDLAEDI